METNFDFFLEKVLTQLKEERRRFDQVIADLERLQTGQKRPRGRPRRRLNAPSPVGRAQLFSAAAGTEI